MENIKQQNILSSFGRALTGLLHALSLERNLKIHFVALISVCIMATLTNCNSIEWSILILCFSVVIGLETMNTAVEKNCDMTTTYYSKEIKNIKDVAAGAVFFASLCSLAIGAIILLPKLLKLF